MTFEANVMQVVEQVLGKDEMNNFTYGTLWVTCSPSDAETLLKALNAKFNNKVLMSASKCHMEYLFDFTA